jgi:hypothetical protein
MNNPLGPAEDLSDEDIDKMVPPKIMRLTQHLHNMIYIRFFYEQIGQQPPEWTKQELTRAERALINELEREQGQGGRLREIFDEARQSRQEQPQRRQAGANPTRRF